MPNLQPEAPTTILIVEDNELNLLLFHDVLEGAGYNVVSTRSGLEVIRLVHEHNPALILMDIQLPVVSGMEVTRRLRLDETIDDMPIIAVTAYAMRGDKERVLRSGCSAYLSKPVRVPELLEAIRTQLSGDVAMASAV